MPLPCRPFAMRALALVAAAGIQLACVCALPARTVHAYLGSSITLDGWMDPDEWSDAFVIASISEFDPAFNPLPYPPPEGTPVDLEASVYIKHDGEYLYFGINVTDDVLYGYETGWWTPPLNPNATEMTQKGWPWFGDENEILLSPSQLPIWPADNKTINGSALSWQLVCNLGKSRLGGIGVGGVLEGEPRSSNFAWDNYQRFIETRMIQGATQYRLGAAPYGGSYYALEWAIHFSLIELSPGVFYNSSSMGATPVGLNIAIGDVDWPSSPVINPGYGINHEMWLSGSHNTSIGYSNHTDISAFSILILEPGPKPPAREDEREGEGQGLQ